MEEIKNNFTLKDIDLKEEGEIINIMEIFINANKCLLQLDLNEQIDEEEEEDQLTPKKQEKSDKSSS